MLIRFVLAALISFLSVPLVAQMPAGWRMRVDESRNAQDPDDRPDIKFMTMGSGVHVTGGPAGVFWRPAQTAMGNYTLKGTFTLMRPSGHTNYYGLVFGGSDLEGSSQNYIYFLVAQDGTYLIKRRAGDNVTDIRGETMHASIRRPDAKGQSVNALEVRVAGQTISYVINGNVVHTTPRSGETARTDGLVGIRINHLLDVMVDGFELQRG
jgi:hypothetical protein